MTTAFDYWFKYIQKHGVFYEYEENFTSNRFVLKTKTKEYVAYENDQGRVIFIEDCGGGAREFYYIRENQPNDDFMPIERRFVVEDTLLVELIGLRAIL